MRRHDISPSPSPSERRRPPSDDFDDYRERRASAAPPPMDGRRRHDDARADRDHRRRRPERRPPVGRDYEEDAPSPPPRPRARSHRRRSYSDLSESPPPRQRRADRRHEPRSRHDDPYSSYDQGRKAPLGNRGEREAGYVSDDRHNRPRRHPDDYESRDGRRDHRRDDKRHDQRYDGLFDQPPRSRRRHDDSDRYGRDRQGRGGREGGKYDWQKEALGLFKAYALPAIKSEGTKYLSKQLSGLGSGKHQR